MENTPESPTEEEALVSKIQELLTESDSETAQFSFEEETIEEVMQQFYNELAGSLVAPPEKPSSPSHVTDAGNNGSCGSFVSDSNSTVMAGIQCPSGGGSPAGKVKMEAEGESDELDDDEWLGRVLSWEQGQPVENKLWF
ncbi:hypothetical protein QN277_015356 [Acacia crassicarpa]|uniref:Uncharacterized protein n=1 Tax=Acacia crassicarpa TaxID=499986 RepID=A0AAE1MVE7_9FABA|nr:hypothetical protein QN277_015356 [Acacia crassicarpa]